MADGLHDVVSVARLKARMSQCRLNSLPDKDVALAPVDAPENIVLVQLPAAREGEMVGEIGRTQNPPPARPPRPMQRIAYLVKCLR